MKRQTINKLLAVAVSAALCVPILLTDATGANNAVAYASGETASGNGGGSSSSSDETSSAATAVTFRAGNITVGSRSVTTTVGGIFAATNVTGAAITTPVENIAAAIGLSSADLQAGTTIRSYICNNRDKASIAALQSAAAAAGKTVATYVNMDLYSITKRGVVTKVTTATEPVTITFGIPGRFVNENRNFSILAIDPSGKTVIMDDVDTDPRAITVNTKVFGSFSIVY